MLKTRPPKRAKSRSAKGCAKALYGVANPPPCERSLSEAKAELLRGYFEGLEEEFWGLIQYRIDFNVILKNT